MTVCVGLVTADGIVVATDSRTSLSQPNVPQRVLSDFTRKVFKVGQCAVATYGAAFLGGRNVAGHVAQFIREDDYDDVSCEDLADKLAAYFGDLLDADLTAAGVAPPAHELMGFLVGGYDDGRGLLVDVRLPSRTSLEVANSDSPGATWRGQTDVIRRIIKGADLDALKAAAEALGRGDELEALQPALLGLEYIIPFGLMNLQDGIDFAVFAIRTTIDVQRLTYGMQASPGSWPGVGGPIEIAAVSPTAGFQWIQRTQLQGERPAGEPEEL